MLAEAVLAVPTALLLSASSVLPSTLLRLLLLMLLLLLLLPTSQRSGLNASTSSPYMAGL
jgi:hypothetical protein